MSDEQAEQSSPAAGDDQAAELARPDRPKLRRRPLGYKTADVDEALEARDSELAVLRQDIAALWLAFAQHDRMIRSLGGETPSPVAERPAPADATADPAAQSRIESDAASIGNQLSELDEVLAAIEMATQTLERTYAKEAGAEDPATAIPGDAVPPAADLETEYEPSAEVPAEPDAEQPKAP